MSFVKPGISAALFAALLFGAGTPAAKILLLELNPWLLAGLLYAGSGLGLALYRLISVAPRAHLSVRDWGWLSGAIFAGGITGPVLLMYGLLNTPASSASLLLNAEAIFTALLAWVVFRENFDSRIALGMTAIIVGAVVLSWPGEVGVGELWPSLAIIGACFSWGIDNNLTRKVSLTDATFVAAIKGGIAGTVNLALAFSAGTELPAFRNAGLAMVVGFLAYGVSLSLFVVSLRHLGTARTGAYFSVAPFFGALISIPLLGEQVTLRLIGGACLMALGVWLHLTEQHSHEHAHEPLEHDHEHVHDEHHLHNHETEIARGAKHSHRHRHDALVHDHVHYPDSHHRHDH